MRVRLDQAIQAPVLIELTGAEDAIGVREGGVLEQPLREVIVEALPTEIPDSLSHDISEMDVNDTITLEAVRAPAGVTIITEADTVLATITPPRLQLEEDEIETETEVVGEGAPPAKPVVKAPRARALGARTLATARSPAAATAKTPSSRSPVACRSAAAAKP